MECIAYVNKEFCKDVECTELRKNTVVEDHFYCERANNACVFTAKDFHQWLTDNNFVLLRIVPTLEGK
jgi:hypothetical protein